MARFLRIHPDRELSADERDLVLRFAFIIAIPLATIVAVALLIGLFWGRHQLHEQIKASNSAIASNQDAITSVRDLTKELNRERKERDAAIAQAVFNTCVENEAQDAVLVNVLSFTASQLEKAPPSPQRDKFITNLRDAILAREPPGEEPCKIPGGNK